MADVTKLLLQATLGNADALVGGPAAGKKWQVSNLHICNTSAAPVTFTLNHATAGASTTGNRIFSNAVLDGAGVLNEAPWVFEDGHSLRGLASVAATVNVALYGIETG